MRRHLTLALALSLAVPILASAASITFDTTPAGATPVDDSALPIATPYTLSGVDVTFGFDLNSDNIVETPAVFEQSGTVSGEVAPNVGFIGSSGVDTPDPGLFPQLGSYFLRSSTAGTPFGKFIVKYSTALTVTACSGEIWDIDAVEGQFTPDTEKYRVQAFDSSNALLGTIDSPDGLVMTDPASLDGKPWVFGFSGLSAGLDHLEITFTGTKTTGIGLAFNNFDPVSVPEPATPCIIALAALYGAIQRRARGLRR